MFSEEERDLPGARRLEPCSTFFRKGEDHSSVLIKPSFGIGPVGFDRLAEKLFGIQVASPLKSFFAETDHARTILAVLISGFR